MREKNYQKDWTKEFEHSKISHPLWVTTAHRQKGEIHIYIYIYIYQYKTDKQRMKQNKMPLKHKPPSLGNSWCR